MSVLIAGYAHRDDACRVRLTFCGRFTLCFRLRATSCWNASLPLTSFSSTLSACSLRGPVATACTCSDRGRPRQDGCCSATCCGSACPAKLEVKDVMLRC